MKIILILDSPEIIHPTEKEGQDFVTERVFSQDGKKVDLYFTVKGNPIPIVVVKRNLATNPEYNNWTQIDVRNVEIHSKVHNF